jgi:acetyl esterase
VNSRISRDEGAEYAMRLTAAGNRVSYVLFSRQIHGFVPMGNRRGHMAIAL